MGIHRKEVALKYTWRDETKAFVSIIACGSAVIGAAIYNDKTVPKPSLPYVPAVDQTYNLGPNQHPIDEANPVITIDLQAITGGSK